MANNKIILYRPVKAYPTGQAWWGNKYNPDVSPLGKSVITQGFGENASPLYKQWGMLGHNGIDIPLKFREPVYTSHAGIVINVSKDRNKGIGCYVITQEYKTGYWHFDEVVVDDGDKVQEGQLLGYGDSTGYSSGNHLHFELKPIKLENGVWVNTLQNNGYFGAINPLEFIIEQDAIDRRKQLDSIEFQLKQIAEKIKELFGWFK